jgi:transcriptional regulator with XRE-family HTH domain
MNKPTRREAPTSLPFTFSEEYREAHEIIRAIFSTMIDRGISENDFAERIGISKRSLEKWRSPTHLRNEGKGPGLVLILRALHALDLSLDVIDNNPERKRKRLMTLRLRNDFAATGREKRLRGETHEQYSVRIQRMAEERRRMGMDD